MVQCWNSGGKKWAMAGWKFSGERKGSEISIDTLGPLPEPLPYLWISRTNVLSGVSFRPHCSFPVRSFSSRNSAATWRLVSNKFLIPSRVTLQTDKLHNYLNYLMNLNEWLCLSFRLNCWEQTDNSSRCNFNFAKVVLVAKKDKFYNRHN